MKDLTRDELRKMVEEVVASVLGPAAPTPPRAPSPADGPRVMIVYHGGTARLDEVENQIREIGRLAGKSGVYTTTPAREAICAREAADRPRSQCRLDTVSREGLDKVLDRADALVLPTFCLAVAAKTARLDFHDEDAGFVLSALVRGKKVLAANDGFLVLQNLQNEGLRAEFDRILAKLKGFGMALCPTENLAAEFSRMVSGRDAQAGSSTKSKAPAAAAHDLVTANAVHRAVNDKKSEILVASGGKVTPLARDLAGEYGIKIVFRGD